MPNPMGDQSARRRFYAYLGFSAFMLLSLAVAISIRYWAFALLVVAMLLFSLSRLKELHGLAWPESRWRFPLGFNPRISNEQKALVKLAITILAALAVVLLEPNIFGFTVGAVAITIGLYGLVLDLKRKG